MDWSIFRCDVRFVGAGAIDQRVRACEKDAIFAGVGCRKVLVERELRHDPMLVA